MASSTTTPSSIDPVKRVASGTSNISRKSMEKATKVPSNITKKGEFGFPNGHLGFLTEEQEEALVEFKKLLAAEGLYTAGVDGGSPSHSDATLLRFLRARRFVPNDAVGQFKDTEQWRKLNELDNLYLNIDVDDFDQARRHYPQWLGRRDKRGIPLYMFRVGALDSKTMTAYTKSTTNIRMTEPDEEDADRKKKKDKTNKEKTPPRLLRLFALYENLAGFMVHLCTALSDRPHPEVPITQSNNIVDISNVGLKQFWNLRGHMQDASVLATAHYPETLDRIFIVGAPSFFPTVWSWIKRWFDPITVSKIFILSEAEAFPTLSQFIEPENIPKQYGGTLDFEFGDFATIEPSYADRLTWKDDGASGIKNSRGELRRWPKGPVRWVEREDGDMDLLAVGSVNGKQRRDVVATLKLQHPRGGWADRSMPRSEHDQAPLASNGTAATPTPGTEQAITNPAETQSPTDPSAVVGPAAITAPASLSNETNTEPVESQASSEAPATATNTTTAPALQPSASGVSKESNVIVPVAATATTTLVPMAVPGTKVPEQASEPALAPSSGTDMSSKLPPSNSLGESVPPVPLAAIAEPLPSADAKEV